MEIQCEEIGPCTRKLSITVPKDDVDAAYERAYRSLAKNARLPGFRQGKAPRHLLERHLGPAVSEDASKELMRESLYQALSEKSLVPVTGPQVSPGELKAGSPYTFSAVVEIRPTIELKQYEGLKTVPNKVEVTDEDVKDDLERMRQQAVQLSPVLDRDFIKPGDLVLADFEGTVGGTPLKGAKAENTLLAIGESDFLPGMSEALMGAKVPNEVVVPVDFPPDHQIEPWRGVKASFQVKLKELKKQVLPELDDDFAKDVGEESLEALRAKARANIEERKRQELEDRRRRVVLESLIAQNPLEVPPSLVKEQAERMLFDALVRVRSMMGGQFSLDGLNVPALLEQQKDNAEFQVKSSLLLLEVAKTANIDVSDDDIRAEIERLVAAAGESNAERARAHYQSDEQRTSIQFRLLETRTLGLLLEKSVEDPSLVVAKPADAGASA